MMINDSVLWTPCSESLPKNDEWKLVTILDDSADIPLRYTAFGWYMEEANCWIVDNEKRTSSVVAWMVLPTPYDGKIRKTGRWIDVDPHGDSGLVFKCSICRSNSSFESNFCPHCGASMERNNNG